MEPNQPSQQQTQLPPVPPQSTVPPTPIIAPHPKPSKLPVILLSIISLLSLSGFSYSYLQTQSLKQQLAMQPSPTPTITSSPNPSPSTTWTTKTYSLKSGFEGGEIVANLEFKLPTNWSVETTPRTEQGILKECKDYVIKAPNNTTTLTLSPICTSWGAHLAPWPSNTKIVMQRQQGTNSGTITKYRVRYSNNQNQYTYIDADSSNQIMDAMMITFTPPNENKYDYYFVPFSLTTTPIESETILETIDQIAASISLK